MATMTTNAPTLDRYYVPPGCVVGRAYRARQYHLSREGESGRLGQPPGVVWRNPDRHVARVTRAAFTDRSAVGA